jgi:hypothetical protein
MRVEEGMRDGDRSPSQKVREPPKRQETSAEKTPSDRKKCGVVSAALSAIFGGCIF